VFNKSWCVNEAHNKYASSGLFLNNLRCQGWPRQACCFCLPARTFEQVLYLTSIVTHLSVRFYIWKSYIIYLKLLKHGYLLIIWYYFLKLLVNLCRDFSTVEGPIVNCLEALTNWSYSWENVPWLRRKLGNKIVVVVENSINTSWWLVRVRQLLSFREFGSLRGLTSLFKGLFILILFVWLSVYQVLSCLLP
jgi:hypothetical protein